MGILGRAESPRVRQAPSVEQEKRSAAASPLLRAGRGRGEKAPPLMLFPTASA